MSLVTEHVEFCRVLQVWLPLPADLLDIGATWQAVTQLRTDSPVGELRDGIQSGALTAKNVAAAIQDAAAIMAAGDHATKIVAELDHPFAARLSTAIRAHADDFVVALRAQFAKHADTLAAAAAILPSDAAADHVLALGSDAARAWHDLAAAASALDAIATLRRRLITGYRYEHEGPVVAAFVDAVDSPERLAEAERVMHGAEMVGVGMAASLVELPAVRGGCWRHLIDRGFTLRLNTADEATAVANPTPVAA